MKKELFDLFKEDVMYVLGKYPSEGGLSAWDCYEIIQEVFNTLSNNGEIQ